MHKDMKNSKIRTDISNYVGPKSKKVGNEIMPSATWHAKSSQLFNITPYKMIHFGQSNGSVSHWFVISTDQSYQSKCLCLYHNSSILRLYNEDEHKDIKPPEGTVEKL